MRYVSDSFMATCSSYKGTPVRWLNTKGNPIEEPQGRVHVESRENGSYALIFKQIETGDRGNYVCTVSDYSAKKGFTLLVSGKYHKLSKLFIYFYSAAKQNKY